MMQASRNSNEEQAVVKSAVGLLGDQCTTRAPANFPHRSNNKDLGMTSHRVGSSHNRQTATESDDTGDVKIRTRRGWGVFNYFRRSKPTENCSKNGVILNGHFNNIKPSTSAGSIESLKKEPCLCPGESPPQLALFHQLRSERSLDVERLPSAPQLPLLAPHHQRSSSDILKEVEKLISTFRDDESLASVGKLLQGGRTPSVAACTEEEFEYSGTVISFIDHSSDADDLSDVSWLEREDCHQHHLDFGSNFASYRELANT